MTPSKNEDTFLRCAAILQRCAANPQLLDDLVPDHFDIVVDGPLTTWEEILLGVHTLSLLWRGASHADIVRYVSTNTGQLPFEGSEGQLFDLLIASLRQRTGDQNIVDFTVSLMLKLQLGWFSLMERETGYSPVNPRTDWLVVLPPPGRRGASTRTPAADDRARAEEPPV